MDDQDPVTSSRRAPRGPGTRRAELVEVAVFVSLILPPLLLSFSSPSAVRESFALGVATIMARDLSLLLLVVYFVWRSREGVARMGLRSAYAPREVALGALLFVPLAVAMGAVEIAIRVLGGHGARSGSLPAALSPHGGWEIALAVVLLAVVAVTEEVIFRGYLLLRIRDVTGSTAWAVLLSSVIFAVGHGYEGSIGVLTIGFMGICLALIRVWRRSLTAPIAIHFIQDLLSVVILPLVVSRR